MAFIVFFTIVLLANFQDTLSLKMRELYYFSPIAAVACFLTAADLFHFVFRPKQTIAFGAQQWRFDGITYRYSEIGGLVEDVTFGSFKLYGTNGKRLARLRIGLYPDYEEIKEIFFRETYAALLRGAQTDLHAGKKIKFGSNLTLSSTALQIKKKTQQLSEIDGIRTETGENRGSEYQKVIIDAVGKKYRIDYASIKNAHIFFDVIFPLLKTV